ATDVETWRSYTARGESFSSFFVKSCFTEFFLVSTDWWRRNVWLLSEEKSLVIFDLRDTRTR
ncbi:unnamed protein product, partial [Amoebophrya sp. A25]